MFVLDVLVREKVALRLLSGHVLLLILDCNDTLIFLYKIFFWHIRPIVLFVTRATTIKNNWMELYKTRWRDGVNVDVDKGAIFCLKRSIQGTISFIYV